MLESIFLTVVALGIVLTILSALDRDEIVWPILTFITWIVCAVTASDIEKPYAFIDAGVVVNGTIHYSAGTFMMYFFLGLAVVFIAIFWNCALKAYRDTVTKKGR